MSKKTGVLLVNLGTPQAPNAKEVRRYLAEFLADKRVVEIPRVLWLPLLYGLILPLRSKRVAGNYAQIWLDRGSPLAVYTSDIGQALQQTLNCPVVAAYRYGQPSLQNGLDKLQQQGCNNIIVLPLYPQFSATTSSTVFDKIAELYAGQRNMPSLHWIAEYHAARAYIQALASSVRDYWNKNGQAQRLLMSFHGLPQRNVEQGDPYQQHCETTARLLAEALQLDDEQWALAYQSRFGKQVWLQPYTEPTLQAWAQAGLRTVDVICPGFPADCLETLEEIRIQAAESFVQAGGQKLNYIPALNADNTHIQALAQLLKPYLPLEDTE